LFGPEDAVKAGLADEVVPAADLLDTALQRAAQLASQPAFAACKRQLRAKADAEIEALLA
jgi:enoyl-CoA hydratase/carnithine racemase